MVEAENRGLGAGWNIGIRETSSAYVLLLNADAWLVEGALERLVDFADTRPRAAVVGPRLLNPDGTLQRSVRGFPTLWRLATEYLFLRKLAPGSSALNAFYAGGFDHDEVRDVEVVMGACMLLRREAIDEVGRLRRGLLPVQRGDGLVLPVPRGRLGGRLLPRRRVRARARRVAQRAPLPREPPRASALPLEAPRRRRWPSARGACCSRRCGFAGSSSAASAGACTATARRGSRRATRPTLARALTVIVLYLKLAFATARRARSRLAARAHARRAQRRRRPSPGRSSSCSARSRSRSRSARR